MQLIHQLFNFDSRPHLLPNSFLPKPGTNSKNHLLHKTFWNFVLAYLVGGFSNPFEKYDRQNGFIFPIKKMKPLPSLFVLGGEIITKEPAAFQTTTNPQEQLEGKLPVTPSW